MLKKLPIGIQTLSKIIEEDYLYIDKTKIAHQLINNYEYIFFSRPRRFGKSLFVDTLQEIFEGNKNLFKGLYIYNNWNWERRYPVIKISFSGGIYNKDDLNRNLIYILKRTQKKLNIKCDNISDASLCFSELIEKAYEKYNEKVVVLIDEYDKPILDNVTNIKESVNIRDGLRDFYTKIKDNDRYIRFALLTGVSKFSKTSIFSGLNNLEDITLNPEYGNICGYTQNDIETSFLPYLDGVDLEKLKLWYNGYNFLGDRVYNPFDILLFIKNNKMYQNYWFESGTPTFLIKLIQKNSYFLPSLSNILIGRELLGSFDIENIKIETLLFQAGYLTIDKQVEKRRGGIEYLLKLPNKEVMISLNDIFIDYLTNKSVEKSRYQDKMYDALFDRDLNGFKESLETIFANIPYNNYVNNNILSYEGYYASVIYAYLMSLGIDLIAEDVTNKGRIDLTIKINNIIYIIEFKVDSNKNKSNRALAQIKDKNYIQKYLKDGKDIYLVGIHFNEKEKNLSLFEWEKN